MYIEMCFGARAVKDREMMFCFLKKLIQWVVYIVTTEGGGSQVRCAMGNDSTSIFSKFLMLLLLFQN